MALERELQAYERLLPDFLAQGSEGKYAVIHGDDLAGIWETYEDALQAAYQSFKLQPFLIKRIQATEAIHNLTRVLAPCR